MWKGTEKFSFYFNKNWIWYRVILRIWNITPFTIGKSNSGAKCKKKYLHNCQLFINGLFSITHHIKLYEHFTPAFWLQNSLCKFTTREHKSKRWSCTEKPGLNIRFKDFWYTKLNLSKKYTFLSYYLVIHSNPTQHF